MTVRASQMRMVESAVPVPKMSPSGWNSAAVYPDVTFSSDTCRRRHNEKAKPASNTYVLMYDPDSRWDACKGEVSSSMGQLQWSVLAVLDPTVSVPSNTEVQIALPACLACVKQVPVATS